MAASGRTARLGLTAEEHGLKERAWTKVSGGRVEEPERES